MTKEKIADELEKAEAKGDERYKAKLLLSYLRTYGEEWQPTTKKKSKPVTQSKKA